MGDYVDGILLGGDYDINIDAMFAFNDDIYFAGVTSSSNFPIVNAYQDNINGLSDF